MAKEYRYLLVQGGDIATLARSLRDQRFEMEKAVWAFCKKHDLKGWFVSDDFFGATPSGFMAARVSRPVPSGWRISERGKHEKMIPRKDAAELRAEIASLPTSPNLRRSISDAIDWKQDLRRDRDDGDFSITTMPLAQLAWAGDAFVIAVPLSGLFGEDSADVVECAMSLPVPLGCREISGAEWELIVARHKVDAEKQAA